MPDKEFGNWVLESIEEKKGSRVFNYTSDWEPPGECECGCSISRNGFRCRSIQDTPQKGIRIVRFFRVRIFRCRACGRTFRQPIVEAPKRKLSDELKEWVMTQLGRPRATVAREAGVSPQTVSTIWNRS